MTKPEHAMTARALTAESEVQKLLAQRAQQEIRIAQLTTVLAQIQGKEAQAEAARIDAELKALGEWKPEAPAAVGHAPAPTKRTHKRPHA